MSKKSQEELDHLRDSNQRIMKAAIDGLGGAADAARELANRGVAPIDLAIAVLGGKLVVARMLGISRQTLDNWLAKPFAEWLHGPLEQLEAATGIPMNVLTRGPITPETAKEKRGGR